jgi:hypothetical protein
VEVKKAELGAYRQWVRNNHTVGKRPFAFKAVTPDEAALCDVRLELVTFKAGDAGPKVRPGHKHWPGWEQDERIANYWSGRLRAALSEAPTRVVARRWLEVRRWAPISKAADPGRDDRRRDALAWLTAIGFTLTPRIRQVLTGL